MNVYSSRIVTQALLSCQYQSGEFIRAGGAGPIVSEWRILIDGVGDEYRELFRWPVFQDEDEEVEL
jgi:hypothetical protein